MGKRQTRIPTALLEARQGELARSASLPQGREITVVLNDGCSFFGFFDKIAEGWLVIRNFRGNTVRHKTDTVHEVIYDFPTTR